MEYREITAKMRKLASDPVRQVPQAVMQRVLDEMTRKTPGSARLFESARRVIPGGVEHMLSPTNPYPVFIDHGEGCHLIDVDGNRYIDYLNGGGPVLLGHNPPSLLEKITEVMKGKGWFHGLSDHYEALAAQKLAEHMPAVEKVRFFQSGTEACMAAIRVARAYTGKKKIVKFAGTYHGWSDQLVIDLWVPKSGRFIAGGIPEEATDNTMIVPLNDIGALERAIDASEADGGTAGVLVEPVGAESGALPVEPGFVGELREITTRKGALLIFDEVVTGFRIGMGGAQAHFGVAPDLTVLGKVIAGCFPSCGAVGGRAEVMDILGSGILSGGGSACFVAGTLAANPLTCAAVYYTISELERSGAVERAADAAEALVSKLNSLFEKGRSGFFAYNYGSILHVETTGLLAVDIASEEGITQILERKKAAADHQTFLQNEGIMTLMGKGFLTSAHGSQDLEATVEAYAKLLDSIE